MEENLVLAAFVAVVVLTAIALLLFVRRSRGRRSIGRILAGNVLVLLFLASLAVLGGEIYYRFVYDQTDSFGLTKTYERWFRRHYQRNVAGIRDNWYDYPPAPRDGKRRITFFGDSFTAGHGVKDVDDRFANLVRHRHPEWEVHVFADNGWDTDDEIAYLRGIPDARDGRYRLDVAVLVYCLNDIADLLPEWNAILRRIYESDHPGFLVRHSFLFNTIYYRFRMSTDPDLSRYYDFTREAYDGLPWEQEKARLADFQSAVRERGGRLTVVIFPFLHALGPDYAYRDAHATLAKYFASRRVPCLDLLDVFDSMDARQLTVNRFDAHPNERAHAMAAEAIEAFLEKQMR